MSKVSEDKQSGRGDASFPDSEALRREEAKEAAPAMAAEHQIRQAMENKPPNLVALGVRYLVPLALTGALVWYMFRSVGFSQVVAIIREGADYWWILLAMGISIFSHVFRAARWRLQLQSLGIKVPFMALCCSIFGCYALNLVFPRLGEVWRCTFVAKKGKAQFTTVLGSMVSDRLTDTLSVLLLTLFTFIVANSAIRAFLREYPVGQNLLTLVGSPFFWAGGAIGLAAIFGIFYFGREKALVRKLVKWLRELWTGAASLWKMKGRWLFALLTLTIWGTYFVQLYVAFFAFGFTSRLCSQPDLAFGLVPCLVAFVLSSIGMAIPSNGGLGPWNIAIMFGLAVYGVSQDDGYAFSVLQWSGQTVMLILLGIFTMAYIAMTGKSQKGPDRDLTETITS